MAKKKLVHYFDLHLISMVTSIPLGEIINNWDATGQIAKWDMELMVDGTTYMPHTTIKSQALVDFIIEWASPSSGCEPKLGKATHRIPITRDLAPQQGQSRSGAEKGEIIHHGGRRDTP